MTEEINKVLSRQNAQTLIDGLSVRCDEESLLDQILDYRGFPKPISDLIGLAQSTTAITFVYGRVVVPLPKVIQALSILN